MKTLITAGTTAASYQLKSVSTDSHVTTGDYLDIPEVLVKNGNMLLLPSPSESSYPHLMLTLCLDNQIDTLYVLREEEQRSLADSLQLFNEYNINVIFK